MAVTKKKKVTRLKTLILTDTHEKERTLKKFLGRQYSIISSEGFLRDLPKSQIGIDVENDFNHKFITVRGQGKLLEQIKKESLNARRIYAVTDPNLRGEMIAFHYCELFGINPASNFRVQLNELTKDSIKRGIENARAINLNLINAYDTHRVVNRLFTYNLQPILEHKIYRGTKISLQQALLLKMICDQEKNLSLLSNTIKLDEVINLWNQPLNCKSLQMLASIIFNLNIGIISMSTRQLFEGLFFNNSCAGLITYFNGNDIQPSSEMHVPDSLKKSLTINQFKLYNLIWNHFNKQPFYEIHSALQRPFNRFNDYLLMRELESRNINFFDDYPISICTLVRRGYVKLTDEGYQPTNTGIEINKIIKDYFSTIITDKTFIKFDSQLKEISEGKINHMAAIQSFYKQFNNALTKAIKKIGTELIPKQQPVIESDEICDKCGSKMVIRKSRYGLFLACSSYPVCKNSKPYAEKIDALCPKCNHQLNIRKFSRGKIVYSCSDYPKCNFNTWDEPQNKTCVLCGSTLFLHRFKDRAPMIYCGNENCSSRQIHPINKIIERIRIKAEEIKKRRAKKVDSK